MNINNLIIDILSNRLSMVPKELFDMVLRHHTNINQIDGDIVECGVWRGGFSIFLASLFRDKTIWVCDSFNGFEPLYKSTYYFRGERHTDHFQYGSNGPLAVTLEQVKYYFDKYDLSDQKRIHFVKGFVNQTLPNIEIENISLLRIDVDSYSATLDVLDNLYEKITPGGYIIFDDACLRETYEAIKTFFRSKNLPMELYNPYTDHKYNILSPVINSDSGIIMGSYFIKS